MQFHGTIHGSHIDLDQDTGLPPGTRVRVIIEPPELSAEQKRALFQSVFRSCADDPTFADAVAEAEAERHAQTPRPIDAFDDISRSTTDPQRP